MPKYSSPTKPTAKEELGFTPVEDTIYVRFLVKQLDAKDSEIKKLDEEVDQLEWDAVYDKIDKNYMETVGPQLDALKKKTMALQAHPKARETAAKAQTANWKEIARQYAPAGVIAPAEFEDQLNDLKLLRKARM
jgi:hypothetical protein